MELRFVVPNMEKTFGNLEFAGENTTEQQRINGRMAVITRSYNLYSDVQRADDVVVNIFLPKLAKSISRRSRK